MTRVSAKKRLLCSVLVVALVVSSLPSSSARATPKVGSKSDTHLTPPNLVQPTNEWVNFYSQNSILNGQPLPIGAVVKAYNPRGVQCGEFVVTEPGWYGVMAVYRDDPQTPDDEGMLPGETVTFYINDVAAMPTGPDTPAWTSNGDLLEVNLIAPVPEFRHKVYLPLVLASEPEEPPAQEPTATPLPIAREVSLSAGALLIPLDSGWNLVSFDVMPADTSITTILAPIEGLYSVVLGYDQGGLSYYPDLPPSMNTLYTMDPYHGYWIRMNSPGTLAIDGDPLPTSTPLSLNPGWNLVSYLPDGSEPVATALQSIDGLYTVVLGYDEGALSYYPSLPPEMNSLQALEPLHGYWIRMDSSGTLVYPEPAEPPTPTPTATPQEALPATPTPMPSATPTPTPEPAITPVYPPATIVADTTWTAANKLYVINQTVTVNQGVVLTIEAGVIVKFNTGMGLTVNGTLIATGTVTETIIFTSLHDDWYAGDTNNNGGATSPTPGDWGHIYFSPSSLNSTLDHALVRYGGSSTSDALVYVSGASPTIAHSRFERSASYAIRLANGASPTITDSTVVYNESHGIYITSSSAPALTDNTLIGNVGYALYMDATSLPRLTGNVALSNGTNGVGVGGTIATNTSWDANLPYVVYSDLTIASGTTLTMSPGAVVKFLAGKSLTVNGSLRAEGTSASKIVFTSIKDDAFGGDTNNDGAATSPAPGDWSRLYFSNSSTNSLIDHAVIRFGGYSYGANLEVNGSAPEIRNSEISYGSGDGVSLTNVAMPTIAANTIANNAGNGIDASSSSAPTVSNNGFVNNSAFAVHMDGSCSIAFSSNTASNNKYNGVGVNGTVPSNSTWVTDLPYIIDGGVTVNVNVVLTLQPGTVVKFKSGNLVVNGTLSANGTSGNKIVFTSIYDTAALAGGLTLGRMTQAEAESMLAFANWGYIQFNSTSSSSVLNYVVVRYGGGGSYGSLYLNAGAPSISNSMVSDSGGHGVYVTGANPVLRDSVIASNANVGVYATGSANPAIHYNRIYDNGQYGVYNNTSTVIIDATNNWWGDASGPTHAGNPGGTGDRVSDYVTYDPWLGSPDQPTPTPYPSPTPTPTVNYVSGTLNQNTVWTPDNSPYVIQGGLTVNAGVVLTIQPGVVVKFTSGSLQVNGTLAANGTAETSIVFTSFKDDNYAGDINNDGAATRPSPGDWGSISFGSSSTNCSLAHVIVKYGSIGVAGGAPGIYSSVIAYSGSNGIYVSGSSAPTISGNTIRNNLSNGIRLYSGSPTISDNIIVGNAGYAISMDASSLPDLSGNMTYYNGSEGIGVSGSVTSLSTWQADLPWVVDGDVSVNTGVVLTIEPGAVVKFTSGSLTVNGGLIANGTVTDTITFSSVHDDSAGGDTNNNGQATRPKPGDWSAVVFSESSLSSSSLTHSAIRYGGIRVIGSSPTISDNTIRYSGGYGISVSSLGAPTIRRNVISFGQTSGLLLQSGAAPVVTDNTFLSNRGSAVWMEANCIPTFSGNNADNNGTDGVRVWGTATTNDTWEADLPYVIGNYVNINSGVVLTLEPGVIVKFEADGTLTANGSLVADGTSSANIIFTSLKDDTYGGDTNGDGPASTPSPGDWDYIRFTSSSITSKLDNVIIKYGGGYQRSVYLDGASVPVTNSTITRSGGYGLEIAAASPSIDNLTVRDGYTGIYLSNAHPSITNSTITDNANYGIRGTGSNPTITGSTISNSNRGIYLYSTSLPYPTINGNTFANNDTYAVSIEIGALPTFGRNTYIGSKGNGVWVGYGTLSASATLYSGAVYVLSSTTIDQAVTLTAEPGTIVKGGSLLIRGTLTANGTLTETIVFTSLQDDAYGGDTNSDGTATAPAAGDWGPIYFAPTSSTSVIDHTTVKYAGGYIYDPYPTRYYGGIAANNSSPTITNSTLETNGSYGVHLEGASPTISGTTISGSTYGVYAKSSSFPSISGNSISSTWYYGIYLDDTSHANISGNTFVSNSAAIYLNANALPWLGQNSRTTSTGNSVSVRTGTIAGDATLYPGLVYVFGNVAVNDGVHLTIQPGTIIKGGSLIVKGTLTADGTESDKIIYTSRHDDSYGGDTNNNGNDTTPAAEDWGGIYFEPPSSGSSLSHAVIKYGGYYRAYVEGTYYDINGNITLNGAGPSSISNSTIANSSQSGIWVKEVSPSLTNNDIASNRYGVYCRDSASPAIHDNKIHGNSWYGVYNATTSIVVDATNNWWGHDSGPDPVGAGDKINYSQSGTTRTYYVAFDPWTGKTYWIEHNIGILQQWIAYVAEPVNTATGNYTYSYQDLRIPGRGLPLVIGRAYASLSTYDGPLGYGWTFNYNMSATEESDGSVLITNEDGRVDKFVPDGAGEYTPPAGTYAILSKNPDKTFTLTRKAQTKYNFNSASRLASIVDKNGNTVTLTYSGGNLTSVTDASGRALTFTYDANSRITQITDPGARTIAFAYDAFGNLVSSTDARGKTTNYTYYANHRINTITDPNGHIFLTNTYDTKGRVATQRDARGYITTFSYNDITRVTTVTDPRGNTTTYTYDSINRLIYERDAAGQTTSYGYNDNNDRTSVTDRRGNVTAFAYDSMGNTTIITDTLAGVTLMTYDSHNNLTSKTDALDHTTAFTYDSNSNLISTTDPASNVTSFTYNSYGLMTSTTDANGNTTAFAYDTYGNQTGVTDALGNTTSYTYDIMGRRTGQTDANGHTTTYTYDANNNVLTSTDAAGGVTTNTYDHVGNGVSVTDASGHTTTYAYNEKDELISVTDALGGVTTYAYDANGNKISMTDALGRTITYSYDALNRLSQVTDPLAHTTSYGYDVEGNRTRETNANGKTTNFTYDALNRLTRITDPLLHVIEYTYDAVGNRTSVADANGNITSFTYDALNRLTQVTDALGGTVTYAYDPVGNKISMTDANGHVTQYQYDAVNRLVAVIDPLSQTTGYFYDGVGNRTSMVDANGATTSYTYDSLNRLAQITYTGGITVTYSYDAVGNRTQMVDSHGTATYTYNALNRVTSIVNPGSLTVSYTYDAVGNRTAVTYPDGKSVSYVYDDADRLVEATDWAARTTTYGHDNVGNQTSQTNPNNTQTTYTYDAANRLTSLINTSTISGTLSTFSYTLDNVGNRIQVVDNEGTTTYAYDALHRLAEVTYPDGSTTSYEYDPMGNRTSMAEDGVTTTYTYDAADRLLSAGSVTFTWDNNGNMLSKGAMSLTYDSANRLTQVITGTTTVELAYDGDGRRASKTVNGTATNYTYDTMAGLAYVLVEEIGGSNTLYTYGADLIAMTDPGGTQQYYHYDGLGSTRNLTNGSGQEIASYTYDVFGAIRSMTGSPTNDFTFAGEQVDEETGLIYLRARYYDPATGRFTTRDPFPGEEDNPQSLNRYVYAENNPINRIDPSGKLAFLAVVGINAGIGAAIGGFFGGLEYYVQHGGRIDSWGDFGKAVAVGAVAGAVGGALGGAVGGYVTTALAPYAAYGVSSSLAHFSGMVLGGAASGMASKATENLLTGKPWHEDVPRSAAFGAISGGTVARLLPSLATSSPAHRAARTALSDLLRRDIEFLDRLQMGQPWVRPAEAASRWASIDAAFLCADVRIDTPGSVAGSARVTRYVRVAEVLQKAGFDFANPQPPPSGAK